MISSKNKKPLKITPTWNDVLAAEKQKPYFKALLAEIKAQRQQGITIFPTDGQIFRAFELTPLDKLKVVIIGQDPYHDLRQACGLAFSVPIGVKIPPSLRNIFKALQTDLDIPTPNHGCLDSWAKQGVLLLNSILTVQAHKAASHQALGWQTFTDHVLGKINEYTNQTIFLLWGAHAQKKQALINPKKHSILTSSHPSPFSAHRGFNTCKHFSQTNQLLEKMGRTPIEWRID